jgi:hypothetical protein
MKQHMPPPVAKKEKKRGWGLWGWRGGTEDIATQASEKQEVATSTSNPPTPPSSMPGSPAKSSSVQVEEEPSVEPAREEEEAEDHSSTASEGFKVHVVDVEDQEVPSRTSEPVRMKKEKFKKSLKLSSEDIVSF